MTLLRALLQGGAVKPQLPELVPLDVAASWLSKCLGYLITEEFIKEKDRVEDLGLVVHFKKITKPNSVKLEPYLLIPRDHLFQLAGIEAQEAESKVALHSFKAEPVQRTQERIILEAIKQAGYNPKNLPPRQGGRPWVKAEIREALKYGQTRFTRSTFDKAWERLRASGELAEK